MKTTWTFNIGLNRNDGRGANSIAATFAALDRAGFDAIDDVRVVQSHTEKTVVFKASGMPDNFEDAAHKVCEELAQDYIAYKRDDVARHGHLVGPRATGWGGFDLAYFFFTL